MTIQLDCAFSETVPKPSTDQANENRGEVTARALERLWESVERSCHLSSESFDFFTYGMFSNLINPVETAEKLWNALKPGFLYAHISDEHRP